jgi:hypothetical protein
MSSSSTTSRSGLGGDGLVGALILLLGDGDAAPRSAVRSDLRFSLFFAMWDVGLPACARAEYDPFHVDLF